MHAKCSFVWAGKLFARSALDGSACLEHDLGCCYRNSKVRGHFVPQGVASILSCHPKPPKRGRSFRAAIRWGFEKHSVHSFLHLTYHSGNFLDHSGNSDPAIGQYCPLHRLSGGIVAPRTTEILHIQHFVLSVTHRCLCLSTQASTSSSSGKTSC